MLTPKLVLVEVDDVVVKPFGSGKKDVVDVIVVVVLIGNEYSAATLIELQS